MKKKMSWIDILLWILGVIIIIALTLRGFGII